MIEIFVLFFGLLFIFLAFVFSVTLRWTWEAYGFFIGALTVTSLGGLNFGFSSSVFGIIFILVSFSFSIWFRDLFIAGSNLLDWTNCSYWGSTHWTQLSVYDFQGLILWTALLVLVLVIHSKLFYDYEYVFFISTISYGNVVST